MSRVVLTLLCMLISACGQGDRGGISLGIGSNDGDLRVYSPDKSLEFRTVLGAKKVLEYQYEFGAQEVQKLLDGRRYSKFSPVSIVEYFYPSEDRLIKRKILGPSYADGSENLYGVFIEKDRWDVDDNGAVRERIYYTGSKSNQPESRTNSVYKWGDAKNLSEFSLEKQTYNPSSKMYEPDELMFFSIEVDWLENGTTIKREEGGSGEFIKAQWEVDDGWARWNVMEVDDEGESFEQRYIYNRSKLSEVINDQTITRFSYHLVSHIENSRFIRVAQYYESGILQDRFKLEFFEKGECNKNIQKMLFFSLSEDATCLPLSDWNKNESKLNLSNMKLYNSLGWCIHPKGGTAYEGVPLVVWGSCGEIPDLWFSEDQYLGVLHSQSRRCLASDSNDSFVKVGDRVILSESCESDLIKIIFKENGWLQDEVSGLCLEITKEEYDAEIAFQECDESKLKQKFITSDFDNIILNDEYGKCIANNDSYDKENPNELLAEFVTMSDDCRSTPAGIVFLPTGMLLDSASGLCLHPQGGMLRPEVGTPMIYFGSCYSPGWKFEYSHAGSFMHSPSGLCLEVDSSDRLFLGDRCNTGASHFSFR